MAGSRSVGPTEAGPAAAGPPEAGDDRYPAPPVRSTEPRRGSPVAYLVILLGLLGGLGWVLWGGAHGVRGGSLTLAGAACAAALARLVLPEGRAGLLASRRRFTDVVTLAVLAAGLLATSLLLPS